MLVEFRNLFLPALLTALLYGCGDAGPGPDIHDTKYRAVSPEGSVQAISTAPGACVYDTFTGLTWEVKTDDGGLRDAGHTYTWYDPEEFFDAEIDYRGQPDGGHCAGSACDTSGYVAAVNATGLCGYRDWRMPGRDELGSISDPRGAAAPPSVNKRHFPLTRPGEYWSANDYQFQHDAAWVWSFENGMDRVEWKHSPRFVRLVRGEPRRLTRVRD